MVNKALDNSRMCIKILGKWDEKIKLEIQLLSEDDLLEKRSMESYKGNLFVSYILLSCRLIILLVHSFYACFSKRQDLGVDLESKFGRHLLLRVCRKII